MTRTGHAIFLSYASQDAEAARRIADSLRRAGIDVWFDADGGLEHGDEWDAKIRRQIKECVLFIPVISRNTQAREEGYFRLEWELAAERAMSIASGVPFILPVVIDDTGEPGALVPDRFRKVQWTRTPGGTVTPEVRMRLVKLWSHRVGVLAHQGTGSDLSGGVAADPAGEGPRPKSGRRIYALVGLTIVGLVVGAGWWLRKPKPPAIVTAVAAVPSSEARKLAQRAEGLFNALDSTRDDHALAEDLLKQAYAKDPTDAEVSAFYAQLHIRYARRGWDLSDERREAARAATQRALRLDPRSFEARFAQAAGGGNLDLSVAEAAYRALHHERPHDQRVLRALASVVRLLGRTDEANALNDQSASLPGGDPLALYNKALNFWFAGRRAEAEAALRASLAQKPFSSSLLIEVWFALTIRVDLDAALATLNLIPPGELVEDRGCYIAYSLRLLRREPDAALAQLRAVPRDWLNDNWFRGPKGLLAGIAWKAAGKPEVAAVEWRSALKLVDARLAVNATDKVALANRFILLANLGEREEAERVRALGEQTGAWRSNPQGLVSADISQAYFVLGRREEALQQMREVMQAEGHANFYTAAELRLHPRWDGLRDDPEFTRIVADGERVERALQPPLPRPSP